jgi:hypothetical protein
MRIVAVLKTLGFVPEFAFDDSEEVSLAYSEVGIRCFRTLQELTMESPLKSRESEPH